MTTLPPPDASTIANLGALDSAKCLDKNPGCDLLQTHQTPNL
ncbi:hypothetical protein DSUL_20391 [Desulfovibrionales bacterium]